MPDFRRGAAAIAEAQANRGGGGEFTPFTPTIFWTNPSKDKENAERYVLFLNELNDVPTVSAISYVPQTRKKSNGDEYTTYDTVIARTDEVIGERTDPMEEEWGAQPRDTCIAVAVELEPVLTDVKGRKRPTGFTVKTTQFDRRIRDDKGELTDETETVEAPVVGFVQQSPHNFFNLITSFDSDTAPIEDTALKVKRIDSKTYTVEGFEDMEVDLTDLIDLIDNLSYVGDDAEELVTAVDDAEDDREAGLIIGTFLLDKYLDELCDSERYDALFEGITEPFRFGKKDKGNKKDGDRKASRRERPARRSQRRSQEEEPEASESAEDTPAEEPEVEEKPKRRTRRKAEPEAEATPEDKPEEKEEKPARRARSGGDAAAKLEGLRERAAARRAQAAA